jgi:hypothetical protein
MAHYAFLDENNVVTEVITGRNEDEVVDGITDWETYYGEIRGQRCVRTSYNANIRFNYAGAGYTYDEDRDAFIAPKPYDSWILNEDTCQWEAPLPLPAEAFADVGPAYIWDEDAGDWVEA